MNDRYEVAPGNHFNIGTVKTTVVPAPAHHFMVLESVDTDDRGASEFFFRAS